MGRRRNKPVFAPYERDIAAAVLEHWKTLRRPHTLVACIPNMNAHGQAGLTPGLPDLLCLGPRVPGGGVGFIELKRDFDSTMSKAQEDFADLCQALGVAWRLAVGRDEPIVLLENWGLVKAQASHQEPVMAPPGTARRGGAMRGLARPSAAKQGDVRVDDVASEAIS